MRLRLLCVSRVEEWRVGRVVFGKNAGQDKWFRLDSLLQDIAAHRPSDPSIVPGSPAIDPQDSVSDRSGVVAPSSQPDIFQSATAATASSQGGLMAARHDVAFIDPGIADLDAFAAPSFPTESFPMTATPWRLRRHYGCK
jgi:hypothetical protein